MIIQTCTFRLVEDADVDAFLEADARVQQEWAYLQPGLVRRTTARNEDGEWLVLLFWDSPEHLVDADATYPSVRDFLGFIELESIRTFETID